MNGIKTLFNMLVIFVASYKTSTNVVYLQLISPMPQSLKPNP